MPNALTTKTSFTATDRVVSIWIGDSLVTGTNMSPTADAVSGSVAYPATLTTAQYWTKWGSVADRLTLAAGAFAFADVPLAGGSVSGALTYVAPYYGTALYIAGDGTANWPAAITHASAVKHHTINLGISASAVNDDTATIPTALAHWEPSVSNGAMALLDFYITPAMNSLQGGGANTVYVDALYLHIGGDANAIYSEATATNYAIHLRRVIEGVEKILGFSGIPVVIIQSPQDIPNFDKLRTVRARQGLVAASRPRTLLLQADGYGVGTDKTHWSAQGAINCGYDAAQKIRALMAGKYAQLTKTF